MFRIQAFEFHERDECPKFIRDGIVEPLGLGMRWNPCLYSITSVFTNFCDLSKSNNFLDLCSGSGNPASILIKGLKNNGVHNIRFSISDLFPKIDAMENTRKLYPENIDIIKESVDATNISDNINISARTIINAFHHFSSDTAREIIADCVRKRHSIFIFEAFPRKLLRFCAIIPSLLAGYIMNPFITKENKTLKIIFSFVFPLIGILGAWDGIISMLRIHSKDELMEMVKDLSDDYHWEYHEIPFFPFGRSVVFFGVPE